MLSSLNIERFRGFRQLEVAPLARVNILVGANNAGKTAVLEAAEFLARGVDPLSIVDILRRREEFSLDPSGVERFPYDIRGLFHGRAPDLGASFFLSGRNLGRASLQCTLRVLDDDEASRYQTSLRLEVPIWERLAGEDPLSLYDEGLLPLGLELESHEKSFVLPLSGHFFRRRYEGQHSGLVRFLGTSLFSPAAMATLWDTLALTPAEDQVIKTLQIIEPSVQRIAVLGGSHRPSVHLQLRDETQRVPLGGMGEGIKRLFSLALAIGNTPRGGTLLVDEVDTGLHHSVMTQMWELVLLAARRFKFQAFFTTHSLDCLLSLSRVLVDHPNFVDSVALHRLERDKGNTVHFAGHEVQDAIEMELEIR